MQTIRIAVVGGGLAGLSSAYFLTQQKTTFEKEAMFDISVFEATDRVGGRVQTLREFNEGLYAEAGALVISDTENELLSLARALTLELLPRRDRGMKRFYCHGEWTSVAPATELIKILLVEIQHLKSKRVIREPSDWSTKESDVLDALDSMSILDYFVKKGKKAEETCALLSTTLIGLYADDVNTLSALDALRFMSQYMRCKLVYSVKGGNDRLPQALANALNETKQTVFLNSPVKQVDRAGEQWQLSFENTSSQLFDYVVMAVPLSMLQTTHTESICIPAMTQQRLDAMNGVTVGKSTARVYCEVNKRFWGKEAATAMTVTDQDTLWMQDHTAAQSSERAIIEACAMGKIGQEIIGATDPEKIAEREMTKIYGQEFKESLVPEKTKTFFWSRVAYQKGTYPYFQVGQRRLHAALSQPLDGMFFAGEYTSIDAPASMNGAVQSARRVVNEELLPALKAVLAIQENASTFRVAMAGAASVNEAMIEDDAPAPGSNLP